jgi:hypothetical protein
MGVQSGNSFEFEGNLAGEFLIEDSAIAVALGGNGRSIDKTSSEVASGIGPPPNDPDECN